MMQLCSLVGSRQSVFLVCGSHEQREIRKGKLSILILYRHGLILPYLVLLIEKLWRLFDSLKTADIVGRCPELREMYSSSTLPITCSQLFPRSISNQKCSH